MTHTSRLLFVASVCALAVLYGGYAFALPHSHEYKMGKGGWGQGQGWYGNDDWDDDKWGDKKKSHKYKKDDWWDHEPKKDWFAWGHGKEHEQ